MKEGWTYKPLADCIDKIPKQKQVKSKDYHSSGKYPIVSQEKELISGYWDDESYLFKHGKPVIIFGDHTKEIKYIDFDFVVGADGTQILSPKDDINAKFFYYALLATPIRTLGYARHFKLLKQKSFLIPPLPEQRTIVVRLDSAFAQIDSLKANAEKQLSEARQLFQKALEEAMTPKEGWEEKTLGDICTSVNYGTSMPASTSGDGEYKYLRMNNITIDGKLALNNLKTISVPDKELEKCLVTRGDLLFNRTNSPELVGKSCIFDEEENMVIGGYIIRIRFNDNILSPFVNYYINMQRKLGNLRPLIVGAVHQANISAKAIQSIAIPLPPLSTQHTIVAHLDTLSSHVRALEAKLKKMKDECDALKQAMLREVFE